MFGLFQTTARLSNVLSQTKDGSLTAAFLHSSERARIWQEIRYCLLRCQPLFGISFQYAFLGRGSWWFFPFPFYSRWLYISIEKENNLHRKHWIACSWCRFGYYRFCPISLVCLLGIVSSKNRRVISSTWYNRRELIGSLFSFIPYYI